MQQLIVLESAQSFVSRSIPESGVFDEPQQHLHIQPGVQELAAIAVLQLLPERVRQAEYSWKSVHAPEVYLVHEVFVDAVLLLPLLLLAHRFVVEKIMPGYSVVGLDGEQPIKQIAGLRCDDPAIEVVEFPRPDFFDQVR